MSESRKTALISGATGQDGTCLAGFSPGKGIIVHCLKRRFSSFDSLRAPCRNKDGADAWCRQFPSGGGRRAAAGINAFAGDSVGLFVERFNEQFGGNS